MQPGAGRIIASLFVAIIIGLMVVFALNNRARVREARHRQTLPRLALRDKRVGETLSVRVHPRKPDRLLVLY